MWFILPLIMGFLKQIIVFILLYQGLAYIYLFFRFLRMKLDRCVKPDKRRGILITGATSGFGLVVSKYLYKLGFTIFAAYYNDQEPGYKELEEISSSRDPDSRDPHMFLVKMDVRSSESIEASARQIDIHLREHNLQLYAVINNAGVARAGPFEWSDRNSINDVIDTNYRGVLMVTRQFVGYVIKSKGRVINISSGLYMFPGKTVTVYGSTKSAVAYFSDALNADLVQYGASCHCIMPGNFITISNIIYGRYKSLQDSIKKLSDDERITCKESIDWYTRFTSSQVRRKLKSSGDNLEQVAKIYKFDISEDLKRKSSKHKSASSSKNIATKIAETLSGYGEDLGNETVLETFKQALCMGRPPRRLFAGSMFYTYISGPMGDIYPKILYDTITDRIMNSLT